MARTIYKYSLQLQDEVAVALPKDAEVLDVQMQGDTPQLWAVVDPNAPTEQRVFRIAGTGHPLPEDDQLSWISTFQMMGGALVFHAFEVIAHGVHLVSDAAGHSTGGEA